MYFEDSNIETPPIVLEVGSATTRLGKKKLKNFSGFAGTKSPRYLLNTDLALITDNNNNEIIFDHNPLYIQENAEIKEFNTKNPIGKGYVEDWDLYEKFQKWLVETKLEGDFKENPLLIIEPPIHNKHYRMKMVELFFEKFEGDKISFAKSPLMASYSGSSENSLVIDIGAKNTYITPIYEGFILKEFLIKADLGGNQLNAGLEKAISHRKHDYLSLKFAKNKFVHKNENCFEYAKNRLVENIAKHTLKVHETNSLKMIYNQVVDNSIYELPDGTNVIVGKEGFDLPESFFSKKSGDQVYSDPTCLQNLVLQCIEKIEPYKRKDMQTNIILTGGCSRITNLTQRLEKELKSLLKDFSTIWKVKINEDMIKLGDHHGWLGGSIISSMGSFNEFCMTKEEYSDHGSMLIERKCLN